MREVLFRGFELYGHGQWVYGHLSRKWDNWFITDDNGSVTLIDPSSIGQYTGVDDALEQKIFEGDLVSHEVEGANREIREVTFEQGMFCFKDDSPNYLSMYNQLEVVGNTYEACHLTE